MRRLLSAALPLLAVSLAPGPAPAQPAPTPEQRAVVAVVGTAEIERKPDFARIHIVVETGGATVAEAVTANRKASEQALARLTALAFRREDIATSAFQVYETPPRRNPDGSERKGPRFTASHRLRVVSRAVDEVGRLAGEILTVEGVLFEGISWDLDRSAEAQDAARREAVADAYRQARVLADAAGVTLGPLVFVGDASVSSVTARSEAMPTMRMAAVPEVPIVPPSHLRFQASVRMEWRIRDARTEP